VEHQNKNMGYLVLWDWIFGTLYDTEDKIVVGIDEQDDLKKIHNPVNIGSNLWGVYLETIRAFFVFLGTTLRLRKVG
jgi:hypothetical protein